MPNMQLAHAAQGYGVDPIALSAYAAYGAPVLQQSLEAEHALD